MTETLSQCEAKMAEIEELLVHLNLSIDDERKRAASDILAALDNYHYLIAGVDLSEIAPDPGPHGTHHELHSLYFDLKRREAEVRKQVPEIQQALLDNDGLWMTSGRAERKEVTNEHTNN